MGALSITGIKPGSTSLKLTAGKITKTVPITVLSRNLLSYGPAEGNGLTATVNTDGRCTSPAPPPVNGVACRGRSHARYRAP